MGASKMSDLKAPTYKYRRIAWRDTPRRSGLYGPTASFREATFSRGGGASKMSDLKAPTY
jgi:hypothetical protein